MWLGKTQKWQSFTYCTLQQQQQQPFGDWQFEINKTEKSFNRKVTSNNWSSRCLTIFHKNNILQSWKFSEIKSFLTCGLKLTIFAGKGIFLYHFRYDDTTKLNIGFVISLVHCKRWYLFSQRKTWNGSDGSCWHRYGCWFSFFSTFL